MSKENITSEQARKFLYDDGFGLHCLLDLVLEDTSKVSHQARLLSRCLVAKVSTQKEPVKIFVSVPDLWFLPFYLVYSGAEISNFAFFYDSPPLNIKNNRFTEEIAASLYHSIDSDVGSLYYKSRAHPSCISVAICNSSATNLIRSLITDNPRSFDYLYVTDMNDETSSSLYFLSSQYDRTLVQYNCGLIEIY